MIWEKILDFASTWNKLGQMKINKLPWPPYLKILKLCKNLLLIPEECVQTRCFYIKNKHIHGDFVRNFEKNTCCVVVVLFRVFRTLIPSFVKMIFLKLCAPKLGIYNTYMYLQISEFLLQLQCQILKWITVGFYDRNCAQLKFLPLLYVSSAAHYELSQGALNSAKSWNFRKVAIFY